MSESAFGGTFVETGRLRQYVWTSGPDEGIPLLLVHGNITTGGFWEYVAEALPDRYRVIAPDLRSFGRADPKPLDATRGLRDFADDVRSLLEALGLTDRGAVHAAGWSMGGGTAAPDFVRRLAARDAGAADPTSAPLGETGAVPGWPGAEAMPPQPMVAQLRAVLERYAEGGGHYREVELAGGHGIPLESPGRVAEEITRTVADA